VLWFLCNRDFSNFQEADSYNYDGLHQFHAELASKKKEKKRRLRKIEREKERKGEMEKGRKGERGKGRKREREKRKTEKKDESNTM
jgi:hypothetical protein